MSAAHRGRLGRYSLFQARDYLWERGIPMLIVAALLLLMVAQDVALSPAGAALDSTMSYGALAVASALLELFAPTATLIAVNGIVSNDRKHQYYRLLFSRPISAPRYYAQSFLVSFAGTIAVSLILLASFAAAISQPPYGAALRFVALYYVLFGGVGFLLSTITRHDWVALGVVWALAWLLRSYFPADRSWYGRLFDAVLPPLHLLTGGAEPLLSGAGLASSTYLWVLGYGTAAFTVGLFIVRYRPMAS